jgi:hypothetical protein
MSFTFISKPLDSIHDELSISIITEKKKNKDNMYNSLLEKLIKDFNNRFENTFICYENSNSLRQELEQELDVFQNITRFENKNKELQKQLITLNKKNSETVQPNNISLIKDEVNKIFDKYVENDHNTNEYIISSNSEEPTLDHELLDKICERVPLGKEILMKNIVKDINGTAKGLSDYVIMFQKYGSLIHTYNKLEYFQRKGCHFIKRNI